MLGRRAGPRRDRACSRRRPSPCCGRAHALLGGRCAGSRRSSSISSGLGTSSRTAAPAGSRRAGWPRGTRRSSGMAGSIRGRDICRPGRPCGCSGRSWARSTAFRDRTCRRARVGPPLKSAPWQPVQQGSDAVSGAWSCTPQIDGMGRLSFRIRRGSREARGRRCRAAPARAARELGARGRPCNFRPAGRSRRRGPGPPRRSCAPGSKHPPRRRPRASDCSAIRTTSTAEGRPSRRRRVWRRPDGASSAVSSPKQ